MGCHFFLQRIFPSQGSNPSLPHFRQTLYHLSHQGSPRPLPALFYVCLCFLVQHGKPHSTVGKTGLILPNTKHTHSVLPNLWQSQKVTVSLRQSPSISLASQSPTQVFRDHQLLPGANITSQKGRWSNTLASIIPCSSFIL